MTLHNTFSGFFDIVHLGTFLYEGWERDWEILDNTDEENAEFTEKNGRLFEVKLTPPSNVLGKFPDGGDYYEIGCGASLEDALDRARFSAIFRYAKVMLEANGWKKQ